MTPRSQETRLAESEELERRRELLANALQHLNDRERRILMKRRLSEEPSTLEQLSGEFGVIARADPPNRGPRLREDPEGDARRRDRGTAAGLENFPFRPSRAGPIGTRSGVPNLNPGALRSLPGSEKMARAGFAPQSRSKRRSMAHLETDVLVVGAGGAGMYAAVAAAREGARVVLADKSLIGRGGATIMAQMTVAAAVGEWQPDHWTHHFADTVAAGRGLCNERLAAILCEEAPIRIHEMDEWKVGWAREDGRMRAVMAPGHQIPRCVYVDFLNTGPAVAKTLRTRVARGGAIMRVSGLMIADLVVHDGKLAGALAINHEDGEPVSIAARAVILAAGGLTRLFRRNSASANMGGDAYALALGAGAELIDMEFPQFFPIGHLAPRLVGMDPIMWDPFRYKLGGRLLNGNMEEFIENYGATDSGVYTAPRDITSYAIFKEAEAGRASPNGGAYLSFQHIAEPDLRAAFGPVIDRLAKNGIDLTQRPIEVAPIAHYHMGGIAVDERMATRIEGLFAAGEAVGGANGANRLSG